MKEIPLKPGRENIDVTEQNKAEYIDLMLKWKITDRVKEQMDQFMKGFNELIPAHLLTVFDEKELEVRSYGLLAPMPPLARASTHNHTHPHSHPPSPIVVSSVPVGWSSRDRR